jgi:hypothetical protein
MRLSGVGVFLLALCLATGSAMAAESSADSPAPFGFVGTEPLSTSCADLASGQVKVQIRNETAHVQRVRYSLDLSDEGGAQVRLEEVCGGLKIRLKEQSLGAGASTTIDLTAPDPGDGKTISGSLAVFGDEGSVARKDMIVTKAPASGRELNATPLVASVSVELHGSDRGPLWIPVKGEVPATNDGEGTKPLTVGAISGPGGPVAVTYNGHADSLNEQSSRVGLEIEGSLDPGTYSGQVDLEPAVAEKGTVSVEVKVSRSVWLAVLLLAIGIAIGVALLRISGRTLPTARLEGRVSGLATRHARATAALRAGQGGSKSWDKFEIKNLAELQGGLLERIAEAAGKVAIQIEKSVVESIEAGIAIVEAQIDLLKEVSTHATSVEEALQTPRAVQLPELEEKFRRQAKPRLDLNAENAIRGEGIEAAKLKPRLEEMDTRAQQVRSLRRLEVQLEEQWIELKALKAGNARRTEALKRDLGRSRQRLWVLADAGDLDAAAQELQKSREKIAELREQSEASLPEPSVSRIRAFQTASMADLSVGDVVKLAGEAALPVQPMVGVELPITQPPPPVPPLPPPPRLTADTAAKAVSQAFYLQLVVVLISALVAVASGIAFLYAGKTWGTWPDILAALIWGITAQATVATLATSLDGLGALGWLRGR